MTNQSRFIEVVCDIPDPEPDDGATYQEDFLVMSLNNIMEDRDKVLPEKAESARVRTDGSTDYIHMKTRIDVDENEQSFFDGIDLTFDNFTDGSDWYEVRTHICDGPGAQCPSNSVAKNNKGNDIARGSVPEGI